MRLKKNIVGLIQVVLLILGTILGSNLYAQQSGSVSTGLESPVNYAAQDSIVASIKDQIVRLYGNATVEYDGITLEAERIEIDIKNNEVTATYGLDSIGQPIGRPLFKGEGEETRSDYIKYNFKTEQGYVKEVRAQQDESYFHMAEAKIHPDQEIHLNDGKFTTCDLDTPHYHFKMTRAIIVPDKRVVTGPIFMKIFKIPTPLAAPFAFLPNKDTKKHGFILPTPAFPTKKVGFGLQNFGYYFPLNDNIETTFLGSFYLSGMFAASNKTNYYKRYKYAGSAELRYEYIKGRFYDTTQFNKWTIRWNHRQDIKAHPSITFDTDINFVSDNSAKTTLQAQNSQYYNNQFNSAINLNKRWTTKNFSGTMSLKSSLQQNTQTSRYTIELPSFALQVSRFTFGTFRRNPIGKKWYDEISVLYSMNASNRIVAADSLFNEDFWGTIADNSLNGLTHSATVQSNLRLLQGRVLFNPQMTYKEIWNFQYQNLTYDQSTEDYDTLRFNQFASSRDLRFTGNFVSNFYGYYRLKGPAKMRFKHAANLKINGSYRPDLGIYQGIPIDSVTTFYYSPFQNSRYQEAGRGESASIGFNLANTFEMKKNDLKDSINETTINRKIIDVFNASGTYDFLQDSMKLSDIRLSLRTAKFLGVFNFTSNAVLSPYGHVDSTGLDINAYAWQNNQGIGRIINTDAAITANFTNRKGRNKQAQLDQGSSNNVETNQILTNPNLIDFDIPWKLNLSYNIRYNQVSQKTGTATKDTFNLIQTIRTDGDFNLGQKWKFTYLFNFDLQADDFVSALTNYNFSIWRDLHCWEAQLAFGQIGPWVKGGNLGDQNLTFLFRINIKASMLSDIKLEINQPPFFF